MRHTLRAAIAAALLLFGILPARAQSPPVATSTTYVRGADGRYTLTVTFSDGARVTIPNLAGAPPVVTPPPGNPGAPVGLAGAWAAGKVTLTWGAVAGAKYNVYATDSLSMANWPKLTPQPITATTFAEAAVAGPIPRVRYYTVTSVGAGGAESGGAPRVAVPVPAVTVPPVPPDGGEETTPPAPGNLPALTIEKVIPNDDSFVVKIAPFPGAVDYLAWDSGNVNDRKASGGNTLLEWNGPLQGKLIVQALAALAPYTAHGQMAGMPGMGSAVTNGQGPPGSPILPIAQAAPITAQYKPITASPGATQFSLYRTNPAVKLSKVSDGRTNAVWMTADGQLSFKAWNCDFLNTDSFLSHTHFMEDLYDGGTPGTGLPLHVQNGTVTIDYSPTFDFSGGRVLHASVEVDAHFDTRRWCELWVIAGDDQVLNPENVEVINNGGADWSHTKPTTSGNLLVWRWDLLHNLYVVRWENNVKAVAPVLKMEWSDPADRFTAANRSEVAYAPGKFLNGVPNQQLDLRSRFDLYLSETRVVGYETDPEGIRVKLFDKPLPKPLGFTKGRIVLTHKLYHSSLELEELKKYRPGETHWIGNTPYSEVRHWDGLYGEVLPAFPAG